MSVGILTLLKNVDNTVNKLVTDTVRGFKAAHDFVFSSTFSTKLYTFLTFKRIFNAFRHVFTQVLAFRIDLILLKTNGAITNIIYRRQAEPTRYSILNNLFWRTGSRKAIFIFFCFSNNLEMKIRSKRYN